MDKNEIYIGRGRNMKRIAIIGANEFQKRLVLKAKELKIETHVFAWEEGAVSKDSADYFYPISIREKTKILDIIREIKIDGICSIASDLAMPTVNYIAQVLNLVGNSETCTILTTNKFEMIKRLSAKGLPVPRFQVANDFNDINMNQFIFPIIVKPIDRSGSRGVYKVENNQELNYAIVNAKKVSFSEYVLVEEYIDGREFSIESISQDGSHSILQITEKFTSGSPNFIETAHLSPARIDIITREKICSIIDKALDALEIQNGASHSEVKLTYDGRIVIIEIAARMGGDFIGSDMVEISTGHDFVKYVIEVALGIKLDPQWKVDNRVAFVKFIFDKKDVQKFKTIRQKYPNSITDFHINEQMKKVDDSSTRNGYYIMNISSDELNKILDYLQLDK